MRHFQKHFETWPEAATSIKRLRKVHQDAYTAEVAAFVERCTGVSEPSAGYKRSVAVVFASLRNTSHAFSSCQTALMLIRQGLRSIPLVADDPKAHRMWPEAESCQDLVVVYEAWP